MSAAEHAAEIIAAALCGEVLITAREFHILQNIIDMS